MSTGVRSARSEETLLMIRSHDHQWCMRGLQQEGAGSRARDQTEIVETRRWWRRDSKAYHAVL